MVTEQSGDPNLLQINFHHFKLVELLVSFPKSPRSLKSEFEAKSYAQNTKMCHCSFGHIAGGGGATALGCSVHTGKGGATPQERLRIGYKFGCVF